MRLSAILFALFGSVLAVGCDDASGSNGSLTGCDLAFGSSDPTKKGFGEGCEQNSECEYGVCLKPGVGGNITNTIFGFCSRGCDCEDNTASRLTTDEKEVLDCLYPAGFKDLHHVVVECANVGECQELDPRWNDCRVADTGNARKVCHAR